MKKKYNKEKIMVLYDAPSGKHIPCLYDENGKFIMEGSIKFTGNDKHNPSVSYSVAETIVSFEGYEDQAVDIFIN